MNTSVMGYGFPQMLQRLLDVETEIEPGDVVIFAPTSADIERNLRFFTYPSRHLFRRSKGIVTWFPDFRDGQLVTARLDTPGNYFKALLFHARFTGPGFQRLHHLYSGVDPQRDSRKTIIAAREIARRQRARFALVFLPRPAECLEGSYALDISSFNFYDLMGFFPSTKPEVDAIHFPGDPHWNRRGHEIAAAALIEVLAAAGVLGPELLARREPSGEICRRTGPQLRLLGPSSPSRHEEHELLANQSTNRSKSSGLMKRRFRSRTQFFCQKALKASSRKLI